MKFVYINSFDFRKLRTHLTIFVIAAFSAVLLVSCSGSKAFYKRGLKLEEQGMMDEAASAYYGALQRNRNNVDAKIGLKNAGQQVLNKKLDEFVKNKSLGDKKTGVYSYLKAVDYQKKIKKIGVTLEIPAYYQSDYEELTQSYLADVYNEGVALLEEGNFTEAETKFKEIGKFDSSYKDANNLEDIAFLEPLYNSATEHLNSGRYRSAHRDLIQILTRNSEFKDSKELEKNCLLDGRVTLALLPFENTTNHSGLDVKVNAYTLDALTKIRDPFLKVVDRENMQLIIEEQQLGLSGVINEESAVEVGNLIGAQVILTGTVLNFGETSGRLQKTVENGYLSYTQKRYNSETEKYVYDTKYKSTSYTKYQKRNRVNVSFQYKVISLETGEVIDSRIVEDQVDDTIVYAEFSGDKNKLFPAYNGRVNTSKSAKRDLDKLLNGRRNIRNTSELTNDLMKDISNDLSDNVEILMGSLVK